MAADMLMPMFRKDDYPVLVSLMDDGERLPTSFDDWLETAAEQAQATRTAGGRVAAVPFDLKRFLFWAGVRDVPLDAASRARFLWEEVRYAQRPVRGRARG
jgi:hypothetical protein